MRYWQSTSTMLNVKKDQSARHCLSKNSTSGSLALVLPALKNYEESNTRGQCYQGNIYTQQTTATIFFSEYKMIYIGEAYCQELYTLM